MWLILLSFLIQADVDSSRDIRFIETYDGSDYHYISTIIENEYSQIDSFYKANIYDYCWNSDSSILLAYNERVGGRKEKMGKYIIFNYLNGMKDSLNANMSLQFQCDLRNAMIKTAIIKETTNQYTIYKILPDRFESYYSFTLPDTIKLYEYTISPDSKYLIVSAYETYIHEIGTEDWIKINYDYDLLRGENYWDSDSSFYFINYKSELGRFVINDKIKTISDNISEIFYVDNDLLLVKTLDRVNYNEKLIIYEINSSFIETVIDSGLVYGMGYDLSNKEIIYEKL